MKIIVLFVFFTTFFGCLTSASAGAEPAIIHSVTDSLGNVQTNSWGAGEGGNWPPGVATPIRLTVGDKITFTVDASDTDGGVLQYMFAVQPPGGSFITKQDWSTSNTWTWNVDQSESGPDVTVFIGVRDDDGHDYMGSFGGDDYTYAIYDVNDPSVTTPAIIHSVTDSLGNVQTNSWGAGEGGNWPPGVATPIRLTVGDKITFTVDASDTDGGVLQYMFSVQPAGGSFIIKQDWSTSNTWTWNVDQSESGPDVTVFIGVKDDDGHDYMGSLAGDDYTYAIYTVRGAVMSPILKLLM